MRKSVRKMTFEMAEERARELLDEITSREDYQAVEERAREMGLDIVTSVRHTYTEEYAASYRANGVTEGRVPVGYAMELWFDITRAGRVLLVGDGETQCSYAAPAIDCVNAVLFNYLHIRDLDYILEHNPICAMLEEFLDGIEEAGEVASPFMSDAFAADTPIAEVGLLTREEVKSGAYVEIAAGAYTGEIGGENSLYFAADAFLPYRLFLHGVTGQRGQFTEESLTLDTDAVEHLADTLEEAAKLVRHASTFTDLFMDACDSPLAPPPRTEQLLDQLTVCRHKEFAADCEAFAEWLRERAEAQETVSVIW